jgi:lipopolysaccharide/colanic/teichoic acid biosynthesis glycosyltransferase/acetyltransferase-like isoleucine patch superfamily enzyme
MPSNDTETVAATPDLARSEIPSASSPSILVSIADIVGLAARGRVHFGRDAKLEGRFWIHGGGKVAVGDGARIGAADLPVELHAESAGEIIIGEGVEIGGGTSIEATAKALIGDGARLGRLCKVLDNSFHTVGDLDQRPPSKSVEIGAGSIIGDHAIFLPGAYVKPGEVVPPGAVVWGPRRTAGSDEALTRSAEPGLDRSWLGERLRDPLGSFEILFAWLRAFLLFRRKERSSRIRVRGSLRIERGGTLRIGPKVTFAGGMIPTFLAARPGGTLSIGEGCYFNYGVTLDASMNVTIGARCKIGSMVVLRDDDGEQRLPIVVGDRVWLAHGVVVKPGVRIGSGSVVSAGSVVVQDVPDGYFVAGNPGTSRPLRRDDKRKRLLPDIRVGSLSNFKSSARQRALGIEIPLAPLSRPQRLVKRTMDIVVAALALIMFLPAMALTAIVIKFDGPGPVIFRQHRKGFNGRQFVMFKFRTMKVRENGPTVAQEMPDDPRVTAIGMLLRSTGIDELPQLINVLKGDMSLIGPRPHALAHDSYFENIVRDYAFRYQVRPGITGRAQCNGARGATPSIEHISEIVKQDLWYINNWSVWLDIQILMRSLFEVLRKRNAY